MTLSRLSLLCLTAAGYASHALAEPRFSAFDLRGPYVFSFQGTLVNTQTGQPIPVAAIGIFTADGEGRFTRATRHLNLGGQIVRAAGTGTYTITPEGIGVATFSVTPLAGEPPIAPPTQEVFHFVLRNRGSGYAVSATIRAANGADIGLLAITRAEFARQEEH